MGRGMKGGINREKRVDRAGGRRGERTESKEERQMEPIKERKMEER